MCSENAAQGNCDHNTFTLSREWSVIRAFSCQQGEGRLSDFLHLVEGEYGDPRFFNFRGNERRSEVLHAGKESNHVFYNSLREATALIE